MLSTNLMTLRDRLNAYNHTGDQLNPSAIVAICAILDAAIEDATQLEARPVAAIDRRVDDLPPNVVRMAEILARRGVKAGPNPVGEGAS